MMASTEEITAFLQTFNSLKHRYGMVYYPIEQSFQTLLACEMSAGEREEVIGQLEVRHYCEGPCKGKWIPQRPEWEFACVFKGRKLRISLSLGLEEGAVFCLAFQAVSQVADRQRPEKK
ncbi:MAG: hypothetical protein D6730_06710 [Bacteroidetes bacterium]|nr:MAG: hypothetical protein D6730_06710 [Bacteroidota bacterium]